MLKSAYIKKEKGKYCVRSKNNPKWSGGCYDTKSEAEERLKQVEAIKHAKMAQDGVVDIKKKIDDVAEYLQEAGFISNSKQLKNISYVLDNTSDNDTFYVCDMAADYIPDNQTNIGNQEYIGGDGTGGSYSLFNIPEAYMVTANLTNIANNLDKKGYYDEADDIDALIKALYKNFLKPDKEIAEISRFYSEEDAALDGMSKSDTVDILAGANGVVGTGVTDNQSSGMSQGLSDAYFYHSYGDLEGPSPVASAPGRV